jgi:hypothetical protein
MNNKIVDYLVNLVGAFATEIVLLILWVIALPLIGVVTPLTDQVPVQVTFRFTE